MATAAFPAAAAPARTSSPLLITIVVMLATFITVLDSTIANVALPHMQASLGAASDTVTWVLTSYIVAAAIATPLTAWLGGKVGRKRLFVLAIGGFVGASMLCGIAQTLDEMVLFRLIQGASGAFLVPLGQSFILDAYPKEKHGQAMALWGVGIMVGPVMGPVLGGWLTDNFDWRWVFFVNLPFGLIALLGSLAVLPNGRVAAAQVRRVRLRRARHRHRRASADARPRAAARLVRLDRSVPRGGDVRDRPVGVRRPYLDRARHDPAAGAAQGSQHPDRLRLHLRRRHAPGRDQRAAAADARGAVRLSGRDERFRHGPARHRHDDGHAPSSGGSSAVPIRAR